MGVGVPFSSLTAETDVVMQPGLKPYVLSAPTLCSERKEFGNAAREGG